jgi:hypothetical protein
MFKKKPILQYESAIELYPNIITPAKNHIPEWYKKIPKWKNNELFNIEKGFGHTVKQCMPFLDSFTTGYMIVLPHDLYIKNNHGIPLLTYRNGIEYPPETRPEVADLNLIPSGCFPAEYSWLTGVANTIPIGYSLLLTHPLNRHDLPFVTLSGVVDGGLIMSPEGRIPFYIKQGFEGIIPQGTPIAQIVPFYQQNWFSKITKGLVKNSKKHNKSGSQFINGWYKKTFWTRKKYD